MKISEPGPYGINEIPVINVDYRGLITYARSKNKTVPELSDKEKEKFIINSDMDDVRRRML